jgi:hypothetical protein
VRRHSCENDINEIASAVVGETGQVVALFLPSRYIQEGERSSVPLLPPPQCSVCSNLLDSTLPFLPGTFVPRFRRVRANRDDQGVLSQGTSLCSQLISCTREKLLFRGCDVQSQQPIIQFFSCPQLVTYLNPSMHLLAISSRFLASCSVKIPFLEVVPVVSWLYEKSARRAARLSSRTWYASKMQFTDSLAVNQG